ncbi:MAG TPA: lipid A biosynthesis acyltransferase [Burkholderiales bacterium]|nr:lipid A biosynthesis acyltransferase [Burkholderiales bacterium]
MLGSVLTRCGIGLLWLLHFLPVPVLAPIGAALGRLGFHLLAERRHVCLVNLAKCFPQMPESERRALAKRHFAALGRSMVDHGILFWSSARRIARLVRIDGMEHYRAAATGPVILLAPHFVGLHAGATRLSMEGEAVSMYSRQKNPHVDRLLERARNRFKPIRLYSRQHGIRRVIQEMKNGLPFYYLPDQDYGARDSIFVPFFGVPAATITGVSRIARLTGARVVPAVTRMLPGARGYEVRIYRAWEDYPTGDERADARRVNAFIEQCVREMPEQYNWIHRRFKTRPPGEPGFY